jgi:hypothetical protein
VRYRSTVVSLYINLKSFVHIRRSKSSGVTIAAQKSRLTSPNTRNDRYDCLPSPKCLGLQFRGTIRVCGLSPQLPRSSIWFGGINSKILTINKPTDGDGQLGPQLRLAPPSLASAPFDGSFFVNSRLIRTDGWYSDLPLDLPFASHFDLPTGPQP